MTHKKMDPEAKAKWVAALRSGKYQQARGALFRPVARHGFTAGYCCLGVLNEVCSLGQNPLNSTLTPDQQASVRLSDRALDALVYRNDEAGWDFARIADWIEKNL